MTLHQRAEPLRTVSVNCVSVQYVFVVVPERSGGSWIIEWLCCISVPQWAGTGLRCRVFVCHMSTAPHWGAAYTVLHPQQVPATLSGQHNTHTHTHIYTLKLEATAEKVWYQGWMWPSMCAWNTKSAIYLSLFCRHFLFKTSSGTTPLFSSSSPGYPLNSGTVYSPPPRLLPRNTFSRSAFKLKKPSKYCSWKCAALSAITAAALLAILLSYFIGKISHSLFFGCSF